MAPWRLFPGSDIIDVFFGSMLHIHALKKPYQKGRVTILNTRSLGFFFHC